MPEERNEGSLARSLCWHCQSEVGGEYFCDTCVKIQPVQSEIDYFERLGVSHRLDLDLLDLEKRFHELSRKFHPDFFQKKSEQEKAISLEHSALLNTAYRTLRDPIHRVEYLINLEEGAVKDIPAKAPSDLLEEIMELQEALEAYRRTPETEPAQRSELRVQLSGERDRIKDRLKSLEAELFGLFKEWDQRENKSGYPPEDPQNQRGAMIQRMKELLSSRAYWRTVMRDLEEGLREEAVSLENKG